MYYEGKTYDFTLHDVVSKDKATSLRTLSPDYYRDMPERVWETHEVAVGVCNSLNAWQSMFRQDPNMRAFLEHVQSVVTALLYETGRYEEYDKWIYEYKAKEKE